MAFLLIIAETYLFFFFVVPVGAIPHDPLDYTGFALLKLVLTLALGGFWFLVMIGLTRVYVRSRVTRSPKPSS